MPLLGGAEHARRREREGEGSGVEIGCFAAGGGRAADLEPFLSRHARGHGRPESKGRFGCACHEGYASLLPTILGLHEDDGGQGSERLGMQLRALSSTDGMMSRCGLRSLSRGRGGSGRFADGEDERMAKGMFRDAEDYWRGKVWMNLNFLALRSIRQYARGKGPNADLAHNLEQELRCRITGCMTDAWREEGEIFENYDGDVVGGRWARENDETGTGGGVGAWLGGALGSFSGGQAETPREGPRGTGAHPFTGWSGLVARILADRID